MAGFMRIVLFESVNKFAASLKKVWRRGWRRVDHTGPTLKPYRMEPTGTSRHLQEPSEPKTAVDVDINKHGR